VPNAEDLAPEVESKVKDSEAKVEIAEKMAMEAEKNPLPAEERAELGDVYTTSRVYQCTIPGWWPVKVYSFCIFCNISISFLVHFHLHFYSFLFYFLPVIVHHVPSLSYNFLRCPIIVYEVANEVPNEFANKILDGVPDEVANEVANEQTSNPQKIKLPMIIT
jgi:hypothetical protein